MNVKFFYQLRQQLLTGIVDLIFPPTKETMSLENFDLKEIKKILKPNLHKDVIYLTEYKSPIIKLLITKNKYEHDAVSTKILAKILNLWLDTQPNTLLVPIPLGQKRQKKRGYNQVLEIIKKTNRPFFLGLKRKQETFPQTSLDRKNRLSNLQGAFALNNKKTPDLNNFKQIIILDDVTTTGSTLNEARATLTPHLPPHTIIKCVAISH